MNRKELDEDYKQYKRDCESNLILMKRIFTNDKVSIKEWILSLIKKRK